MDERIFRNSGKRRDTHVETPATEPMSAEPAFDESQFIDESESTDGSAVAEEAEWIDDIANEDTPAGIWWPRIALAILGMLAIGWIALYCSAELWPMPNRITPEQASSHLIAITPPLLLLLLLALFVQRGARAELRRHKKVSHAVHNSGEALARQVADIRLEVDAARQGIDDAIDRLTLLSGDALARLTDHATRIGQALGDSEQQARTLERVSDKATHNLSTLTKDTPVMITYARDLSNAIAEAGTRAIDHMHALRDGWEKVEERQSEGAARFAEQSRDASEHFDTLDNRLNSFDAAFSEKMEAQRSEGKRLTDDIAAQIDDAGEKLIGHFAEADIRVAALLEKAQSASRNFAASLEARLQTAHRSTSTLLDQIEQRGERFDSVDKEREERLREQMDALNEGIRRIGEIRQAEGAELQRLVADVDRQYGESAERLDSLSKKGREQSAELAFALNSSRETIEALSGGFAGHEAAMNMIIERNRQLSDILSTNTDALAETLPDNLARFAERLSEVRETISEQTSLTRDMENQGERLIVQFGKLDRRISAQRDAIEELSDLGENRFADRNAEIEKLTVSLTEAQGLLSDILNDSEHRIDTLIERLGQAGIQAGDIVREGFSPLGEDEALGLLLDEKALLTEARARAEQVRTAFLDTLGRGIETAQGKAGQVERKLARLEEMATALESRIATAQRNFTPPDDESFARRMALLTDSLNSAAIDVAKILSTEVSDTAWQRYLKGDRGVFTRRAVRLLDNQEAKIVAEQYEWDDEFRAQINRYIRDFEDMMRQLLSTREGHRISVTLLSSDVGKLYVALAQAIERLRA